MSLELEIELLKKKVLKLTQKNRILNDTVVFYADPLRKWDEGRVARETISRINKGYKPVNGNLSVMFKQKEIFPFIQIENSVEVYGQEPIEDE